MTYNGCANCENCAYSDDGESPAYQKDGDWLLCRWHPPVIIPGLDVIDDGFAGVWGMFPRVSRNGWCGEWRQNQVNTGERRSRTYIEQELEAVEDEDA